MIEYLYPTKLVSNLNLGDIIFLEVDDNNLPIDPSAILDLTDMKVLNIVNKSISSFSVNDNEFVYLLGNIYNYINITELMKNIKVQYTWLGIVQNKHKILINLKTADVEYLDLDTNEWELSYSVIDKGKSIEFTLKNLKFRIKFCDEEIKIQYKEDSMKRYKDVENFLFGFDGDYVFDENNNLNLIQNSV